LKKICMTLPMTITDKITSKMKLYWRFFCLVGVWRI
jgi:hypothetical protein